MTDYTLYLVLNRESIPDGRLLAVTRCAIAGGVSLVQWRDKSRQPIGVLLQELHGLLRSANIPLIVNDDAELAYALGAEGVHLGQEDGDPVAARALLGQNAIVGRSVTNEEQLLRAASEPIDYVGVGPVYPTATKLNHAEPLGVAGVASLRKRTALPVVAIGGITVERAPAVAATGVDGLAVVSAICNAQDPERAAVELRLAMKRSA